LTCESSSFSSHWYGSSTVSPLYSVATGFFGVSGACSAKLTLLSISAAAVASNDRKRFALIREEQRPGRLSCKKILLRSGQRRRCRRILRILYLVTNRHVQLLYRREARVIGDERRDNTTSVRVDGIRGARLRRPIGF